MSVQEVNQLLGSIVLVFKNQTKKEAGNKTKPIQAQT